MDFSNPFSAMSAEFHIWFSCFLEDQRCLTDIMSAVEVHKGGKATDLFNKKGPD